MHDVRIVGAACKRLPEAQKAEVDPMLPSQNLGTMPLDPNTQRAIEELAFVINDVEQRLQLIRMSIAQAVPTPWSPLGAHNAFSQVPGFGAPGFGSPSFHVPSLGTSSIGSLGLGNTVPGIHAILANPALLQQLLAANVAKLHGGIAQTPYGSVSPFGTPLGVNAPFGLQSPFQAPFTPFRF